jgi:opacity protein-like surface antigen
VKKKLLIVFIGLITSSITYAQAGSNKGFDIGVIIGGSYYIGDLNTEHFNKFTKPAGGVMCRYNFTQRFAARASFMMGNVEAHDSESNSLAQQQRNLNFRSTIQELSAIIEFNFLDYKIGGKPNQHFSPYIFVGLAGFHFKPEGEVSNGWMGLRDLGTEGQDLFGYSQKKYKLNQVSIPFGVGIKTNFSKGIGIGVEWGMRRTFTDYLDDVSGLYYDPKIIKQERGVLAATMSDPSIGLDKNFSNVGRQRGNSQTNDWYSFFGVILSIKIAQTKGCVGALSMGEY